MSSSVHVDNKKEYIFILGEGPTQGLDDTTLTAKKILINFKHYNGANSYLFVNSVDIIKFKAKDSEIKAIPLRLGSVSKDFSVDNLKKTKFYGYVYDFSVDYDVIAVDDMLDIHTYLMKKKNIK